MSTKDTRYYRDCPICGDRLVGTDDGLEVYESLKGQIEDGQEMPNCTLCGEERTRTQAEMIIERGEPKLHKVKR